MTRTSRAPWGAIALLAVAACSRGKGTAAAATRDSTADPKTSAIALSAKEQEHVKLIAVKSETYRPTVVTTGTVAFDGDVSTQVLAPISGPVIRILADVGARVKKGDPLAIISSPDFAAAVSAFRKAQAAAIQTQKVAELNAQLFKADGIAKRDYDQSVVDAESAAADREAAIQELKSLGVDSATLASLRDGRTDVVIQASIRAPLDGTVVERLINPGQLLQAGTTPCFTVADLTRMWVLASVFESDLPYVAPGDRAQITGAALARPLTGTAIYVAALVDPTTRATSVRLEVPNIGNALKRDMYVEVALQSSRTKQGLLLPVSAVLRDEDNLPFVFIESAPGSYARRPVTLGGRLGDRMEVRSGLKDGDRVISEGGLFLEFAQSQ